MGNQSQRRDFGDNPVLTYNVLEKNDNYNTGGGEKKEI